MLKIIVSYFSGITSKNKLPLSKSLSFHVSILNKKVVDNNIIKCFGSNTILCFDTGWKFSISYLLINIMKMSGMLIRFYEACAWIGNSKPWITRVAMFLTILSMSDCLGMCLQIIDNGVSIGTSA